MTDEIFEWLGNKIDANDPAKAGMHGAVSLVEATLAFGSGGARMAFGLMLPTDASGERLKALETRARATLQAWGREASDEQLSALLTQFSAPTLASVGLDAKAPPAPAVLGRVVCTFPATLTRIDFETDDEDVITDEATLRAFDGLRPDMGFDDISDLPCFMDLDWLLGAGVALRFDAARSGLVCELTLESDRIPDAATIEEARGVGPRLWESSWSLNLEWEPRDVEGFGPDRCATFFVDERALEVRAAS